MKPPSLSVALSRRLVSPRGDFYVENPHNKIELSHNARGAYTNSFLHTNSAYQRATHKTLILAGLDNTEFSPHGRLQDFLWSVGSWSGGVLVALNSTILVYSGRSGDYTLTRIIQLSQNRLGVDFISHFEVTRCEHVELLYVLENDKKLTVISLKTCDIITQIELDPVNSATFTVVTVAEVDLVVLKGSSSTLTIISHESGRFHVSPVVHLEFWPKGVFKLNRYYLYVIGANGQFQTYRYNVRTRTLILADRRLLTSIRRNRLGDPQFGKILDLQQIGSSRWALLQEKGWMIYELADGRLVDLVSSPLTSRFEKLVAGGPIGEQNYTFAVLMASRDVMLVCNDNVQLLETGGFHILDIFFVNGELWGFSKTDDGSKCTIMPLFGSTGTKQQILRFNNGKSPEYSKAFVGFSVRSDSNGGLAICGADSTSVLAMVDCPNGEIHDVLEIPHSPKQHRCLVVVSKKGHVTVVLLSADLSSVMDQLSVMVAQLRCLNYVEQSNLLEICSEKVEEDVFVSLNELRRVENAGSGAVRVQLYQMESAFQVGDVPVVMKGYLFGNDVEFLPFEHVFANERHQKLVTESVLGRGTARWIGLSDEVSSGLTFCRSDVGLNEMSLKFMLLFKALNGSDKRINELFLAYSLENFHDGCFLKELCSFCFSPHSALSESSLELMDELLAAVGHSKELIVRDWLANLCLSGYPRDEDELRSVYAFVIFGVAVLHEPRVVFWDDGRLAAAFVEKLYVILDGNERQMLQVTLRLLSRMGMVLFSVRLANPAALLRAVLQVRFRAMKERNGAVFSACNGYLESLLRRNEGFVIVVVGFLLSELPRAGFDEQVSLIDFMNYLLIESSDTLLANNLFILVDSVVCCFAELHEHSGRVQQAIWDSLDLTTNVLTTNFHDAIGSHFSVHERHLEGTRICVMLDDTGLQLGYTGVVLAQGRSKIIPLKIESEGVEDAQLEFLRAKMGSKKTLSKPTFSADGSKVACFDFGGYCIWIWDLKDRIEDSLAVNALENADIPLKVADFDLLFLQAYLNSGVYDVGNYTDVEVLEVLREFQERHGHRHGQGEVVLSRVRISLVDLMCKYYDVFGDIGCEDLDMEWVGGKILLKLRGGVVFMYE